MNKSVLQIHPRDNVAVSLRHLEASLAVEVGDATVRLAGAVPPAHKFALRPIRDGEPIVKFGEPIGRATRDIGAGAWVHVHNLRTKRW